MNDSKKIAVIGAGWFGCFIANNLIEKGYKVDVYEKENDIFSNASGNNQNRLHLGFHYPRSKKTIIQSKEGFIEFKKNLDSFSKKIPKNYYFISSHEPCSMCLSAITWSGFDNFYYFFPYEDTSSSFNIPHDLNILKEVFNMSMGNYYTKNNQYWNSFSILNEINKVSKIKREKLLEKVLIIKNHYLELSNKYQHNKNKNNIPLN